MKLTTAQNDRACGVILGSAVGDALGAGYEFGCAPIGPDGPEMIGGGLGGFAPGEWTDDTSMTWVIAEVAAKGADLRSPEALDDIARGFLRWYDSNPPDIGMQTSSVLGDVSRKLPEELAQQASRREGTEASKPGELADRMTQAAAKLHEQTGHTAGNGSVMRTSPVALAHLGDPAAIVEAAMAISALTHTDPRAGEACALWSLAIDHAVLDGELEVRVGLPHLSSEARAFWAARIDEAESRDPSTFTPNGYVVTALQAAWSAIHHTPVPDEMACLHLQHTLDTAIRIGNDTDTVAAIAGGLLGARWGASAVPAAWRRIVHGYPGRRVEDLVELAFLATRGGQPNGYGWPGCEYIPYWQADRPVLVQHPFDEGVWLGNVKALDDLPQEITAVVSLCLTGSSQVPAGVLQVPFRLIDESSPESNLNLELVITDAARAVADLRADGHEVLIHCVAAESRTPTVGIAYAMINGVDVDTATESVCAALPSASVNPAFPTFLRRSTLNGDNMTTVPSAPSENFKIGRMVKANVPAILASCEEDPSQLDILMDKASSKDLLGIHWPFAKASAEITPEEHSKFWTTEYNVLGRTVRVTSQWFEKHRPQFLNFLHERGIASAEDAHASAAADEEATSKQLQATAVSKARYKGVAIGNAQNLFVRTLLGNLGREAFTQQDWLRVIDEFDNRCAYCLRRFDPSVPARRLVMDHAVPINQEDLGEHRLGNLVPACHACNTAKGKKDYRDFCADDEALVRIEAHMEQHRYTPIDNDQVRLFVQTAYKEVRELSQRYLLLVNSLLPADPALDTGAIEEAPVAEREEAIRLTQSESRMAPDAGGEDDWLDDDEVGE